MMPRSLHNTLHVSTRSTRNRRLSGGRDSSEPRRANARAELNLFVYSVYSVVKPYDRHSRHNPSRERAMVCKMIKQVSCLRQGYGGRNGGQICVQGQMMGQINDVSIV